MSTPLSVSNDQSFQPPIGLNNNRSQSPIRTSSPSQPRNGSFSHQPQPIAGPSRLAQSPATPQPHLPSASYNAVGLNGQIPQNPAVDQLQQARMALAQQAMQNGQLGGHERRVSGGGQDWASMTASMGMMNGGQGLSREAMLKQVSRI
jgi:hypothetical protein